MRATSSRRLFRDKGFQPVQCETGEDGLSSARKNQPVIVFLDIMLPDLDGYKSVKHLSSILIPIRFRSLLVTALTSYENKVRGFRVVADFYVTKHTPTKRFLTFLIAPWSINQP